MKSAEVINTNTNFKVNPKQFTLWVFLVSVTMLFAGFTSAYIVRKAEGDWMQIDLPNLFSVSLGLAIASSLILIGAQIALKAGKQSLSHVFTFLALVGGIGFVLAQLAGWQEMTGKGIYLVGNASAGFLYLISGLHLVHVAGGIIALIVLFVNLFNQKKDHSLRMTSVAIYWHFVGILWVYLYLFFKFV